MKALGHEMAARLTQIDYDREMALVLTGPGLPGQAEIFAVVRIAADPDLVRAEYAITVRDDMTGLGLGPVLMRRIIDYARARGITEVFGSVLRENQAMLAICKKLGFRQETVPGDRSVVTVRLAL